ncbi:MAG: hypothetical protein BWZ04_03250 [Firmicutes bacterium ADurb.BinA205]|nr:MAG: hypothetical protein BWZ04_03250 [Firmicutes bacterium ADurb.BinA205]
MVNVSHNYYNRCTLNALTVVIRVVDKPLLYCYNYLLFNPCSKLFSNKRSCIKVNYIVYSTHFTKTDKLFDNL